ncbi:DinB family protein [Deinococcus sp. KNUC1210]|uniref:DinB family protein n=1 Tax=Deinococcus sp. KNUC1210 TaxID=2917691 RepID=UPI001EF0C193|nr:DinB family protein [Deinococcus sp. KNUC1210]ULH16075.1 DinB family protein [Deinococcus sp. KNUC1210]
MSFPSSVQDAVSSLFYGGSANVSWQQALDGLDDEQATRQPPNLPHSVAALVAHVQFWQTYLLAVFRGEDPAWIEHAPEGWPTVTAVSWPALKEGFFADMDALARYAQDEAFLMELDPEGRFRTVPLTSFAAHGIYHLGQVVSVRQALGLWPPPGGGDTW